MMHLYILDPSNKSSTDRCNNGTSFGETCHPMVKYLDSSSLHSAPFRVTSVLDLQYEITEDERKFQILMDVPGVKAEDIKVKIEQGGAALCFSAVRKIKHDGNEKELNFDKTFKLSYHADLMNASAYLYDGVLTLIVPKKGEELLTQKINVIQGETTSRCDDDGTHKISMDVPGVKATDMKVELRHGGSFLYVSGDRKIKPSGKEQDIKYKRYEKKFVLGDNADLDNITAHLSDGVLVVSVPRVEKIHTSKEIAITRGEAPHQNEDDWVKPENVAKSSE